MNRRIGILGGTFDPIHRGHLDLGEAAQSALALTAMFVVPAHVPPHRPAPHVSGFHRFAMVALAVAGRTEWQASDVELTRAEPSYSAATLARFHADGYRPNELYFVIGADAFADIGSWKDYPALLDATNFAVVSRPGYPVRDLRRSLAPIAARMIDGPSGGHERETTSIFLIDAPTADVSATAIRQRAADGLSIAGMVPAGVEQHIAQHRLYAQVPASAQEQEFKHHPTAGRLHGQS